MKKLLLGCAALALFASVLSVMLWRDLRSERELSAGLQSRLVEAEARIFQPASLPVAATRAPVAAPTSSRPEPASSPATRAMPVAEPPFNNVGISQRDMLKDPEYRRLRLALTRLSLPENYPGLAEELGLSPEQVDRLFDLLAEHQLERNASAILVPGPNGQIDQAQREEQQRQQQELRAKQDATLTAMLGDARMGKWRDYQQNQGGRQQVTQLGRTMEAMGMPLTSAQKRSLTEVMAAEQARQQQEQQAMREMRASLQGPASRADPQTQARLQEENLRRQAESNRRLVDAMAPHLNAKQLELYRTQVDQQLAMNRISSRLQREAAEQNRSTAPMIISAPQPAQAVAF
jgi:hypothetical protein